MHGRQQFSGEVLLPAVMVLLAPQSGAHRRGAYRDFHSIPIPNQLIAFEHLSLYTEAFKRSKAFYGDLWQSVALPDH